MQLNDYKKWIDLNHDLALVEYDLREASGRADTYDAYQLADDILFSRFGVAVDTLHEDTVAFE